MGLRIALSVIASFVLRQSSAIHKSTQQAKRSFFRKQVKRSAIADVSLENKGYRSAIADVSLENQRSNAAMLRIVQLQNFYPRIHFLLVVFYHCETLPKQIVAIHSVYTSKSRARI